MQDGSCFQQVWRSQAGQASTRTHPRRRFPPALQRPGRQSRLADYEMKGHQIAVVTFSQEQRPLGSPGRESGMALAAGDSQLGMHYCCLSRYLGIRTWRCPR